MPDKSGGLLKWGYNVVDKGGVNYVIYLDLCKAFNSVLYGILDNDLISTLFLLLVKCNFVSVLASKQSYTFKIKNSQYSVKYRW